MIDPEYRFWSEGACYCGSPEDPESIGEARVWNWDQLHYIKVTGTAKVLRPYELEPDEIRILARFVDCLSPKVRAVSVDDEGLLYEISTDPEEDMYSFLEYLPFSMTESLHECRTVKYSQSQELDRLGPGVDLSEYHDESGISHKVAFKFNPIATPQRERMQWDEINLLKSLPPHPNIVPFDRVVLDVESRVIGFTEKYIPGGTLDNPKRPFRLKWLQQLTQVVDFLNLDLGIMIQDIAPRNLLVDPETQNIVLFDFNCAACGKKNLVNGADDVTGVWSVVVGELSYREVIGTSAKSHMTRSRAIAVYALYELITVDKSVAHICYRDRSIETLQNMPEWICNRELDSDVSTFRKFLNDWVATRRSGDDMQRYLNAPNRPQWPDAPTPPNYNVPFQCGTTAEGEINWRTGSRSIQVAREQGQYIFNWERPPQSKLKKSENNE